MSQATPYVPSAVDSSIRIVRDTSHPTSSSNADFETSQVQSIDQYPPPYADLATKDAGDITVTTSLEVASTSPFSTNSQNMASRDPRIYVEAPNTPERPSQQTVRLTKSAAVLKQTSLQPPRAYSMKQIRPDPTAVARKLSQSGASSRHRTRQPEFQQSRGWAKAHEPPRARTEITHGKEQQGKEQKTSLTTRETSFEQQRAQPNISLQSPKSVQQAAARALSDTDSVLQAQGLCRSLSGSTWRLMKNARTSRPKSLPAQWVARKLSIRRHRRTSSRRSDTKGSVDLTSSTPKASLKRRLRPRKAVADLRRKAGFASSTSKLTDHGKVVDLDSVGVKLPVDEPSNSPVPSLHDPNKIKRFSQECGEALSNPDFEKHWRGVNTKPGVGLELSLDSRQNTDGPRPKTSSGVAPIGLSRREDIPHLENGPDSRFDARKAAATRQSATAPEPPVRTSSKGGPRLASSVHITRRPFIRILHGSRDEKVTSHTNAGEDLSTIGPSQSTNMDTPTKKPSGLSTMGHRGPRQVASTDTLSRIEAQMQETSTPAPFVGKHKQMLSSDSGQRKQSLTALGVPPKLPLPALPPKNATGLPSSLSPEELSLHGSQIVNSLQTHLSDTLKQPQLQQTPVMEGPTLHSVETMILPPQSSPTIPTPSIMSDQSSTRSQISIDLSHPPFQYRQSKLGADRIRRLKKGIRDNLANLARERRISEEDENSNGFIGPADRPLPALPSTRPQSPVDPIDQFPCPPESRPQSRASVGTGRGQTRSRSRSHARHSSKASSIRGRHTRQKLGPSEIKVLVDTDPATGNYTCGATIRRYSMAGSSRVASPVKNRRRLSNASTNISTQGPTKEYDYGKRVSASKPSLQSLKSQASSRPSLSIAKPPRRRLSDDITDSEDETYSQKSPARSKRASLVNSRMYRKSNDVVTLESRNHDLELKVLKLEHELMLREKETQKSARVMAPIFHANGLKAARYTPSHSDFEKQLESLSSARSRLPKEKKVERVLDRPRPISHISSGSATTNLTIESRGTDEGSMTDPLEHDMPSLVYGTAGRNAKTQSSSRPGSRGSLSGLHHPPPVAKIISSGKLAEEEGTERVKSWNGDKEVDRDESRFSLDHGFSNTEQMDAAIEAFRNLA